MGGRPVPEIQFQFCICPVYRKQGLVKNVGASTVHCTLWLTRLYSYVDCESAWQIRVLDWYGNEFVAYSFGSIAVTFKSTLDIIDPDTPTHFNA
ncbi:hypothetical protein TNCV_3812801 [Trichonephila clavipes]|nr:hypothetical protein TNCV_3812801 [Trichonephila clavipes]